MAANERLEPTFSFPGIGGSLGKCALCGKDFVFELLTNQSIATLHLDLLKGKQRLPMHQECADKAQATSTWPELPEGPLRTMFERASQKPAPSGTEGGAGEP